ncbi:phosphate transport system substrate-binding protein [Ruminococcaceae bacterium YRB3002]|nr:phosphate transport system substrate-binding protein [Ruminococcaceae bacterium YRB3002]
MKRVAALVLIVVMFAALNLGLYMTITRRLRNNFSGADQLKMVDVARYLPFEPESDLARTGSSFHLAKSDDLPVLDGAAALVPVYASVIENCYPEGCVTYEGGVFSDDNYYGENFASDSAMKYQNTIRGFDAVVDGSVDLFFTAHPSPDQMASAEEKGVELKIVPIGLESFVFFVNKDNPVDGLTVDQIRAIYRNEITDWSEVGGPERMINPLTRIKNSGSQMMMDKFMQDNMFEARLPLSIFGGAIGYSFRYYLSGLVANDNVKMLSVNGVYPSAENIRNGTYPITTNFYVVYRADNDNPNVERVVDWLLSDEGQQMIEGCGYVGLGET